MSRSPRLTVVPNNGVSNNGVSNK